MVDCFTFHHEKFHPPKTPGVDDVTGESLVRRADDNIATLGKRLLAYHSQKEPLIQYYSTQNILKIIEDSGDQNLIFNTIKDVLENMKTSKNEYGSK